MLNKQIVCLFRMIMCEQEHLLIATKQADSSSHFPSQVDYQMFFFFWKSCKLPSEAVVREGICSTEEKIMLIALLVRNLGHPTVNETSLLSH